MLHMTQAPGSVPMPCTPDAVTNKHRLHSEAKFLHKRLRIPLHMQQEEMKHKQPRSCKDDASFSLAASTPILSVPGWWKLTGRVPP